MRTWVKASIFVLMVMLVFSYAVLIAYAHDLRGRKSEAVQDRTEMLLARKADMEGNHTELEASKVALEAELRSLVEEQQAQKLAEQLAAAEQAQDELLRQQQLAQIERLQQEAAARAAAAEAAAKAAQVQTTVVKTTTVRPRTRAS